MEINLYQMPAYLTLTYRVMVNGHQVGYVRHDEERARWIAFYAEEPKEESNEGRPVYLSKEGAALSIIALWYENHASEALREEDESDDEDLDFDNEVEGEPHKDGQLRRVGEKEAE